MRSPPKNSKTNSAAPPPLPDVKYLRALSVIAVEAVYADGVATVTHTDVVSAIQPVKLVL